MVKNFSSANDVFRDYFWKEAWFSSYAIAKETPAQVFSYEFCKVFKNNYFVEHMW